MYLFHLDCITGRTVNNTQVRERFFLLPASISPRPYLINSHHLYSQILSLVSFLLDTITQIPPIRCIALHPPRRRPGPLRDHHQHHKTPLWVCLNLPPCPSFPPLPHLAQPIRPHQHNTSDHPRPQPLHRKIRTSTHISSKPLHRPY